MHCLFAKLYFDNNFGVFFVYFLVNIWENVSFVGIMAITFIRHCSKAPITTKHSLNILLQHNNGQIQSFFNFQNAENPEFSKQNLWNQQKVRLPAPLSH